MRVELSGSQLVGEVDLRSIGGRFGRERIMGLSGGEFRLKHSPRRKSRPSECALGPIGASGEADLMVADLKFFELDVLSVRCGAYIA